MLKIVKSAKSAEIDLQNEFSKSHRAVLIVDPCSLPRTKPHKRAEWIMSHRFLALNPLS